LSFSTASLPAAGWWLTLDRLIGSESGDLLFLAETEADPTAADLDTG